MVRRLDLQERVQEALASRMTRGEGRRSNARPSTRSLSFLMEKPMSTKAAPSDPQPVLSVRSLSKSFNGRTVLKNVSLDVTRGQIVGLLGQNGCGKSTMIKVIAGYHEPDPGAEIL